MFNIIKTRLRQGYHTMAYPDGPAPALPDRFAGRPALDNKKCTTGDCSRCADVCPTAAVSPCKSGLAIDTGKCLFCRACARACPDAAIEFTTNHQLAAADKKSLIIRPGQSDTPPAKHELASKLFKKSLKLRQVSAAGCNACEADSNVLTTLAWDIGRFGIQFVASPRHADGLLITGPVSQNMHLALKKTYDATPSPKIVIAVGSCAISGGPYIDHPEQHNGADSTLPVDLFVPGCPPHPLTILDALLRFLNIPTP